MSSRRDFLAAAAGVVFCSCGLTRPAHAAAKLPVSVGGKKVKTIDVHTHCIFPEAMAMFPSAPPVNRTRGQDEAHIVIEQRLKAMDAQAIDMEVLSVNPFWYNQDRDISAKANRLQNEKLAELCAAKPDRFAAFGCLTLQDPALAVQELEYAVKKLGLKGAAIGDTVNGEAFSNPKFDPVWAKTQELGAALFIHPQGLPELGPKLKGNGWLTNAIGYPAGTTIALSKLIFDGTLDKFPGLKVISAHGGGFLPSYADRSDHACLVNPAECDPNIKLKKKPTEYLKQLYFDSLVFSPEALRHLVAQVGVSQVMVGSDYPYPWELHPVDHVMSTNTLSNAEKIAILGGNAARVLGIKA